MFFLVSLSLRETLNCHRRNAMMSEICIEIIWAWKWEEGVGKQVIQSWADNEAGW